MFILTFVARNYHGSGGGRLDKEMKVGPLILGRVRYLFENAPFDSIQPYLLGEVLVSKYHIMLSLTI